MKTEDEIRKRIEWVEDAIEDEDNLMEFAQIKLYAQLDTLKWIIGEQNG